MAPLVQHAMTQMPSTTDVIDTINDTIGSQGDVTESSLAGGVRVVVPDDAVGKVFGALRRNGFEYESKRGPSGDAVIFNIEATDSPQGRDSEQSGLEALFSD